MTKFLWQHPPVHTVDFHCEEDDTPTSLWTKERASRTTSKRPERIVLKKFLPADRPMVKVSGPLWTPKKETTVSVTVMPVIPTPPSSPKIKQEQKSWLWQPAAALPPASVEEITASQPYLWASSTAARTTTAPLVNVEAPKKFYDFSPLPVIAGSLWTLEAHKTEKPSLWKKPAGYWRLPTLPVEKTYLWSALTAKRTTNESPACPPGAVRSVARKNDLPAAATGALWVASMHEQVVDRDIDWLHRSSAKLPTPVDASVLTPPTTPTTTTTTKKHWLWCKETAARTTTAMPERLLDGKVNVRVYPEPVKAVGQLWSLEASKKDQEAKMAKVELWKRPMDAWRLVTLAEIEEKKNARLWIKATARRTTEASPIKCIVKPVVREYELVSFAGVKGLWSGAEKQNLWQKAPVRTLAVQYPHIPLYRTFLWNAQSARRFTDAAPIRLDANPSIRVNDSPLVAAKGKLWNETLREVPHLWQKPAVRTLAVQYPHIPLHKPLLWCAQSASRNTTASPVRLGEVKPRPQDDTPLPCFNGLPMWGNTSVKKSVVFTSELWRKPAPVVAAAYTGPLWEAAHASRTTAASPIRAPVVPRPQDNTPLAKATGALWSAPKPAVSLWTKTFPATGMWHPQGLTPSLDELQAIQTAKSQPLWANHAINARRTDRFIDTERIVPKPRPVDNSFPIVASGGLWSAPVAQPATKMCELSNFGLWTARQVPAMRVRTDTLSSAADEDAPATPTSLDSPALSIGGSSVCEYDAESILLDAPAFPVKPLMTFLSNHLPHPHHPHQEQESDVDSGSEGGVDVDDAASGDRCLVRTDTFNSVWCQDVLAAREESAEEPPAEKQTMSAPTTPAFGGMNRFLVLTPPASPTVAKGKGKAKKQRHSLQPASSASMSSPSKEEGKSGRRMWMGRIRGMIEHITHEEASDGEGERHHGWFGRKSATGAGSAGAA